jgi:Na+/melibiose symporter-like transporter
LPGPWVGTAIMIALVCDAISDPIIGCASDNLRSRWGRRHPFMYASVLLVSASYFLLWSPPPGLSHAALFAYLVVLAILIRTFITLYEIPSASLAPELTGAYDERTSLLGYRFFFGWWGGLAMAMIAFFVLLRPTPEHPVGQLNPDGWRSYGVVAACIMVVAILASVIGTHRHIPRSPLLVDRNTWECRKRAEERDVRRGKERDRAAPQNESAGAEFERSRRRESRTLHSKLVDGSGVDGSVVDVVAQVRESDPAGFLLLRR